MDTRTLLAYIAAERARGVLDADIRTELLTKGWDAAAVDGAIGNAANTTSSRAELPPVMQLIKDSFDELWKNVWKSFLIMVVPIGSVFILGLIGGLGIFFVHSTTGFLTAGILVAAALFIMCITMIVSIIMLINEAAANWTLSYTEAFTEAIPHVIPLVFVSLLSSLAIMGGMTLLIVPGFLATLWFAFAQIATVLDGKRGMKALTYSKALVRDNLLVVFVYYAVACALVMLASLIVSLIPIIGAFIGFLTAPFMIIFTVRFYRALQSLRTPEPVEEHSSTITTVLIVIGALTLLGFVYFLSLFR